MLAQLTDGLSWSSRWRERWSAPSKSAIFQARARLGFEPLEALFRRVARPLAGATTPGSWLAGRRLVAIDGTCVDVADTPENATFFGRPGVNKGEQAAFPQARLVGLVECGTHAIFDAEIGACTTGEVALSRQLVGRLRPGMLCVADRGFYGFKLCNTVESVHLFRLIPATDSVESGQRFGRFRPPATTCVGTAPRSTKLGPPPP